MNLENENIEEQERARILSPDLKAKLENLPNTPGVYHFKDALGKSLYIGKAKILRNRVRQYFQSRPQQLGRQASGRLEMMISKIADIELIATDSEVEALILELNMIRGLKPRYNVNFKDDKSYPYIVITNEPFPRVFPTRKKRNDGSKYFGPYTDVKTMRFALKSVRDIFMIRSCNLNITEEAVGKKKFKICLDYHIHKCEGPCEGFVARKEYCDMIDQVAKLLNGKTDTLIRDMTSIMNAYAETMQFEKAAKMRDKINAVEVYSSRQKVVTEDIIDRDIFAIEKEDKDACGMVLKIRDGKVVGKTHYYVDNVLEKPDEEILETFLMNYYSKTDFVPDEVFLEREIDGMEAFKSWLQEKKQDRVDLVIPKIGEKAKLVNMVKNNAKLMLGELLLTKLKREFIPHSIEALKRDLRLTKLPRRIECFDISHIQGTDTVASMVVFHDGKPKKSGYRKYRLKSVLNEIGQPDDFLAMREVIYRRFRKYAEDKINKPAESEVKDESAEQDDVNSEADSAESEKEQPLPDLIVIDGGKGQLSSAVKVLEDLGMDKQNIIGLAKRLEEVYVPGNPDPQSIPHTSSGLKLLQRIRDEAHRFAITYHRTLREKRTIKTELNEITGIGNKTAQKLLIEFGSVEMLKQKLISDPEEFEKKAGKKVTQRLKEYYDI